MSFRIPGFFGFGRAAVRKSKQSEPPEIAKPSRDYRHQDADFGDLMPGVISYIHVVPSQRPCSMM